MGLHSQTIKNLIAGISQQPSILRHPEQLEEQFNGMSTEVGGLQKRPPTLHVRDLDRALFDDRVKPFIHVVSRDVNEQYTMAFTIGGVAVWDMLGNRKDVIFQDAYAKDYLSTATPRKHLRVVTIADYTFVVNTQRQVKMGTAVVPNVWATQGALINVKSGQYGRTYSIYINGGLAGSFATPDGSVSAHSTQIDTNYIANQLAAACRASGYTVATGEGWLYITTAAGVAVSSVETRDGYNNQAMFGFTTSCQKFTNLPAAAPHGYTVEVIGENGSAADNYYVTFDGTKRVW